MGSSRERKCDGLVRNDDIYWTCVRTCYIWISGIEGGLTMEFLRTSLVSRNHRSPHVYDPRDLTIKGAGKQG